MKTAAILTRMHKWIGLIVGVQIVLWTAGGLVMSVAKIEDVRSEHLIAEPRALPIDIPNGIDPLDAAKAAGLSDITALQLESFAGDPVWRITSDQSVLLLSATTGRSLLPLSMAQATTLAVADYTGSGKLLHVSLVEKGPIEVRGRGPLYQAVFSQPSNYSVWVDIKQGRIIARRSNLWRLFDFFWMLHIMDYDERDDFNHPLLIIFSLSALVFSLTGISLLVHRFVLRPRKKRRGGRSSNLG